MRGNIFEHSLTFLTILVQSLGCSACIMFREPTSYTSCNHLPQGMVRMTVGTFIASERLVINSDDNPLLT